MASRNSVSRFNTSIARTDVLGNNTVGVAEFEGFPTTRLQVVRIHRCVHVARRPSIRRPSGLHVVFILLLDAVRSFFLFLQHFSTYGVVPGVLRRRGVSPTFARRVSLCIARVSSFHACLVPSFLSCALVRWDGRRRHVGWCRSHLFAMVQAFVVIFPHAWACFQGFFGFVGSQALLVRLPERIATSLLSAQTKTRRHRHQPPRPTALLLLLLPLPLPLSPSLSLSIPQSVSESPSINLSISISLSLSLTALCLSVRPSRTDPPLLLPVPGSGSPEGKREGEGGRERGCIWREGCVCGCGCVGVGVDATPTTDGGRGADALGRGDASKEEREGQGQRQTFETEETQARMVQTRHAKTAREDVRVLSKH